MSFRPRFGSMTIRVAGISCPSRMLAREIREHLQWQEQGWGRLKASAQIGDTRWDTAIWFDTSRQTYLLPVKASIRKMTGVVADQTETVILWV